LRGLPLATFFSIALNGNPSASTQSFEHSHPRLTLEARKAPERRRRIKTFATPLGRPSKRDWLRLSGDITMRYLSDCYRPEQHYMRGAGPKWLEKHAGQSGAIVISSECHRGTSTLSRRIELTLRHLLPAWWRRGHAASYELPWDPADRLGPWSV